MSETPYLYVKPTIKIFEDFKFILLSFIKLINFLNTKSSILLFVFLPARVTIESNLFSFAMYDK